MRAHAVCLLLALALAACETAAPPPPPAPVTPPAAKPVDVLLLPVGNVAPSLAQSLANRLGPELGLEIKTSLPMGDGDLTPMFGTQQVAAEDVIARAHEVGSRFATLGPRGIVIALTSRDINARGQSSHFVFAQNDPNLRASVLSLARLDYDTKTNQKNASPAVVFGRLYKMTKRIIGEQLLGVGRSSDIHDVMYSPINSLTDIDAMGTEFAHRGGPAPKTAKAELSLPPAPKGYTWQPVDELRGAVLVPDGWHFHKELKQGTIGVFVTQEEIGKVGYETGVAINAFIDNPSAPARLKQMLDDMAAKNSVKLVPGAKGPFATLACEFDSPREGGLEPVHTGVLGILNTRTSATYLITVESPLSQWRAAWARAEPVVSMLALDHDL